MNIWISYRGGDLADRFYVNALNGIILNSMPNSWSKQAYFQGFYFKSILFKKYVNMFKHM